MDKCFGLSEEQAQQSARLYGTNVLTKKKKKTFLKRLLEGFCDPMIRVLLIALVINVVLLFKSSDWFESVGIAVAVLVATFVSAVSEHGSEAAFERLQEEAMRLQCRVRRDGRVSERSVQELVRGDIVLLGAGDRVPADGVLISGALDCDQSALNGESKECAKRAGEASGSDFLNPHLLFCGTVVVSGEGIMSITEVGDNTFYGKLASELSEDSRQSPLKLKLSHLAKKISVVGYSGAFLAALAYLFNAFFISNSFNSALIYADITDIAVVARHLMRAGTLAVTVIVMAVPEGLPMMVTVVLSANMKRMLKNNVLVRKLVGIETAGSLNILFTDKTGTLTRGQLEAVCAITGEGSVVQLKEAMRAQSYAAALSQAIEHKCSASISGKRAIGGNATDRALALLAHRLSTKKALARLIRRIPFCSESKMMLTQVQAGAGFFAKGNVVLVKGAPEKLISQCNSYMGLDGQIHPFLSKIRLTRQLAVQAEQAMRLVAVAAGESEQSLTLIAVVGISDQLRSEARSAVRQVKRAGVQVVMITGDAKTTAAAVALDCGILSSKKDELVLSGAELSAMSDEQLGKVLPQLRVVARAQPQDKSRLVRIAQQLNMVVGMTGDGVNDAPALKRADVGFAMGSGTEVCKEAGDIIILDDNILSISRAISFGRTIFKSIRKFIIFQLTVNFCALAVSIIAPFIGVDSPITVIQMLWINLVIDTLAGLAFGGEQPRASYMLEPPKRRDEPIINAAMRTQIAFGAIYCALLCILFLLSPWFGRTQGAHGSTYALTTFFMLFMFLAIFNSFCARTSRRNLFEYLALNKQFIFIMGALSLAQLAIVYTGGAIFRTAPLLLPHLILIILLASSIIPVDLVRKTISSSKTT